MTTTIRVSIDASKVHSFVRSFPSARPDGAGYVVVPVTGLASASSVLGVLHADRRVSSAYMVYGR